MKKPPAPPDETARLRALQELEVLDTPPEERFDRFTRLACRSFGVPIALISLVDEKRQWFLSRAGLDATETPREVSFCGHAILEPGIFVVEDSHEDDRFRDNPLVTGAPGVRFYAGCPLAAPDGSLIGTLCLIDDKPRSLDDEDLKLLRDFASMVEDDLSNRALALTDELTGLSNRRGFLQLAERALALCRRFEAPASLCYLDLNEFKPINDRFGHEEGDRALCAMAGILLEGFRDSDLIARIGGDEFCVLLTGASDVKIPCDRLERELDAWNQVAGRRFQLSYSIGSVDYDARRHDSVEDLMREADELMLARKRESKTGR